MTARFVHLCACKLVANVFCHRARVFKAQLPLSPAKKTEKHICIYAHMRFPSSVSCLWKRGSSNKAVVQRTGSARLVISVGNILAPVTLENSRSTIYRMLTFRYETVPRVPRVLPRGAPRELRLVAKRRRPLSDIVTRYFHLTLFHLPPPPSRFFIYRLRFYRLR